MNLKLVSKNNVSKIQVMKLTSTNKIIITVFSLSVLVLIILILVILPSAQKIKEITEETYNLRSYMEKKYTESLQSKLTKNKLEEIKTESKDFSKYLFTKNHTLELIQLLENLATKNKITQSMGSTNLDSILPDSNININLNINGEYKNVLKYINDLESLDYFINITTLRLSPGYDKTGQIKNMVSANLNIEIYVSK